MIHIAPSILAADFAILGEQVADTERAGAQRIHFDVMDGHFVPNLSLGPAVLKSLRARTSLPLEVHLMVEKPADFVEPFIKNGADTLIVHHEVLPDPKPLFRKIHDLGARVGFCINPGTPVEAMEPHLADIDLALCMTVHPGFGGQAFIANSPERIRKLRELIDRLNPRCELEVDGGITTQTALLAVKAGANVLVSGTGIFRHSEGIAAAIHILKNLA